MEYPERRRPHSGQQHHRSAQRQAPYSAQYGHSSQYAPQYPAPQNSRRAPQTRRPPSRRRPPKPPIRALCICAAIIFCIGMLVGFFLRGFFLPKDKPEDTMQESTPPAASTQPPSDPPATTTPPETTVPPTTVPPVQVQHADWKLYLVNWQTPLPEDFTVSLTKLANGLQVDKRCYAELQEMLGACKAAGLSPVVASAYRTLEKQNELYESRVRRLQGEGLPEAEARDKAAEVVAIAGTSEHHLGLAVDLVDMNYQTLDEGQEQTEVQKWLMEHSWEYGFILRYPNGKTTETGIIYEPWHYRYVGKEYAKQIHESGLCLEEWLRQASIKTSE